MQLIQSWMFVPGQRQNMIDKALKLAVDGLIFDLEDGVPAAAKASARTQVAAALALPPGPALRFVRVHAADSPALAADLEAVVRPGLDGLALPQVDTEQDIQKVVATLEKRESEAGIPPGHIRILALIESTRGLIQAPAIAAADPRLAGLMFGAEDFALNLGLPATDTVAADDFLYARSALAIAAASAGLQAVDRVYLDLSDVDGLFADTRRARQLGFTGKALIHPAQIEKVHDALQPSAAEVDHAQRIVEAFSAGQQTDQGAVVVDGRMVDLPIVERARRTLDLHQRRS